MVDKPSWMVKCNEVIGLLKPLAVLSWQVWAEGDFFQQEMSVRQADIASSYRQIIRMDWDVELSESQNHRT